ncbi:MAG: adenylyl-sulfate kinase, partial [Angustibacter sp.]
EVAEPIAGELRLAQRPPLLGEAHGEGPLTVIVPVENPTPDGLPAAVLLRSVRAALTESGRPVTLIAAPLCWRDPASDAALIRAVLSGYGGRAPEEDSTWSAQHGGWRAMRRALEAGDELQEGLAPAAQTVLRAWRPPRAKRGVALLCTGFSGSGKSTLARDLAQWLLSETERTVTLLDGDDVRRMLSAGLGFDRAARELNVRRIGYVASEIARHGGIAICAPIAPYEGMRAEFRSMVESAGDFVLIHVDTPLAECERRDLKGLYAKARAGVIPEFTGISDPYDPPADADLRIDTSRLSREQALARVLDFLARGGWLSTGASHGH